MIICTVTSTRYLPKAIVMAKSAKTQMPNSKVVVCLVEERIHHAAKSCEYFDRVVLAKDLGFENFYKHIFKYRAYEAVTSVKGQFFIYLLESFPKVEQFIFLDTDIKIFGPFDELIKTLDKSPIIVTPHLTEEEKTLDGIIENELVTIVYGICNTGFLAIKRTSESERFLQWWANRLAMFCYDKVHKGMYVDQKWVDLALSMFDVHILKHPGYNVARWNITQRRLTCDDQGMYFVNGQPLRFFHFSGLSDKRLDRVLKKYFPKKNNVVYQLKDNYKKELKVAGLYQLANEPWSYDYFVNGEKIKKQSRKNYRDSAKLQKKFKNPFEQSNSVFL